MGFVIYATYGFIQEYYAFNVQTDMKIKSAREISLPSVSICESGPRGFTCYRNRTMSNNNKCNRPGNQLYDYLSYDQQKYAVLHPVYPERCIVINSHGNLTTYNFPKLRFRKSTESPVNMYVHSHNDFTIDIDDPTAFFYLENVKVHFSKKQMVWRLQSPYSSKCIEDNDKSSIFSKPYTTTKCKNTCVFNRMLSECGDVIQQWQDYLPPKRKYQNRTEAVHDCLNHLSMEKFINFECVCPMSCYDMHIDTRVEVKPSAVYFKSITFEYLSDTFTEIRESPAYPASHFVTDIGGWLSLFTGMSILSLLEVIITISLAIITICQKCVGLRRN